MPDDNQRDKPNADRTVDPENHEVPVTGVTNDQAASQTTITIPKKAPSQEEGKPPSKFVPPDPKDDSAPHKLKELWDLKHMDPHLEEMLKDSKAKNTAGGLIISLDKDHEIFVGNAAKKDIIGVPQGHKVDAKTAETMVAMAKQKGWDKVYCTLSSDQAEKDCLWLECQRQGLKMGNYTPDKDSDIVKKWEDEQKNGRHDVKLTNVDPDANHLQDTVKLIKDRAASAEDPALKAGLTQMADKLAMGNLHVDDKMAKAISNLLGDHPDAARFNATATSLNQADPSLKIATVDPGAGAGGQQPTVKVTRANTAGAAM